MQQKSMVNMDLPTGVVRTKSGHLRYTAPKEKRHKYVHRAVIDDLLQETPYSIKTLLPWPYEVHHIDYNKENNAPHNLLLLSEAFHSALTAVMPRDWKGRFYGKFKPKWQPPPEWVLFDDSLEDEIPF